MNKSLLTLCLDFNSKLGSNGVASLCRGLRTNSTLKKLSLKHCSIDGTGGISLGEMLSFPRLALKTLDLTGNSLRAAGLISLCPGLSQNASLSCLLLSDNNILSENADVNALQSLAEVMAIHKSLTKVEMLHNPIGSAGGVALLKTLGSQNMRLSSFKIDTNMDNDLYKAVFRTVSNLKKKKGGGKKKSKKKK